MMAKKKKRGEGYDWSTYKGTKPVHYTQIPDDWLDTLIPQLGEAEVRVLLCIGRHTYGWKKQWDEISLNQIAEDTGLSRTATNKALKALEEKGIINVERTTLSNGGAAPNRYAPRETAGTQGGSASQALGGSASQAPTRYSRTRDKDETKAFSSLINQIHQEFAPGENPQAIQTYLSRFPAALITKAAEITRAADNKHKPIAYMFGVLGRLVEQESYLPAAQRQAPELPELTSAEYQASLQALDRVKQQIERGGRP